MEDGRLAARRSISSRVGLKSVVEQARRPARSARSCRRTRRSRRWRSRRGSPVRSARTTSISACGRRTSAATARARAFPWLGMPIAELETLDRVLVIGSFLRKDHPLAAQRLRHAARKGARDLVAALGRRRFADSRSRIRSSRAPSMLPQALAEIVVAAAQGRGQARARRARRHRARRRRARRSPRASLSGERKAILLGNYAEQHPEASQLFALAQALAEHRRREARLPHGSREQRRRLRGRRAAADRRRARTRGRCSPIRARRTSCSARSRSSTARIPSLRARRSKRRSSSS